MACFFQELASKGEKREMMTSSRFSKTLIAGDMLVWLAFTLGGIAFHHVPGSLLLQAVRIGGPFFLGYFVAALLLGALSSPSRGGGRVRASVGAWSLGTGLGILLRTVVEGRYPVTTFVLITYAFSGFLLLGWRAGYGWLSRSSEDPS